MSNTDEQHLREELSLLRTLADHVPAMLAYWDATEHCRYANRAYEEWFGHPPHWVVGRTLKELLGPVYALNRPFIEGALRGEAQTFERELPDPAGGPPRTSVAHYVPHRVEGEVRGFFVLVSDVSLHRRAEARFRAIVDSTPIPYALNDEQLNITYLNPEFVRVFGYTRDDIPTLNDWWPHAYPDPEYRAWVAREWNDRLAAAKRDRAPFEPLELQVRAKEGAVKTVLAFAAPLGAAYEGTHLVVLYDLTRTREIEAERENLAALLSHSQRLEALGRLAGGVAHDFNNLLAVILSGGELALDSLDQGSPAREDVTEMMAAAQRAAALTRQLLTFSRRDPLKVLALDLSQLLTELGRMLQRLLGEDVRLHVTGAERPHVILGDGTQLEQVLTNLCVNAREAMPRGGDITIALAEVDLDATRAARYALQAGPYVTLAVTDTGRGMDATTQDRIFEPFFTTKTVGKGTGLGLATVFGVVKQCAGAIEVASKPNEGTTFRLFLPRAPAGSARAVSPPAEGPRLPAARRTRNLVLVEDDAAVRKGIERQLAETGYTVVAFAQAAEALRYLEHDGAGVDLLLSDVLMPDMRGTDLARRARSLRPGLKVLFISGFPQLRPDETLEHPLLAKPFQRDELLQALDRIVGD